MSTKAVVPKQGKAVPKKEALGKLEKGKPKMNGIHFSIHHDNKQQTISVVINFQISSSMATTNGAGAYVGTRVEGDTDMNPVTQALAKIYEMWEVPWVELEYDPLIKPTQGNGSVCLCILKDVDDSSPGSMSAIEAIGGSPRPRAVYEPIKHRFYPGHGWLYTKDGGISVDRLEMPFDIIYGTESCDFAAVPGLMTGRMMVRFKGIVAESINYKVPPPKVTYNQGPEPKPVIQIIPVYDSEGKETGEYHEITTLNGKVVSDDLKTKPKTTTKSGMAVGR